MIKKNIKKLKKNKGISQKELAKNIGASDSAICFWENGINEPKATYIYQIATFFDVSADYLLGLTADDGTKLYSPPTVNTLNGNLSRDERELIEKYRKLNAPGKKLVNTVIDTHLDTMAESKQKNN